MNSKQQRQFLAYQYGPAFAKKLEKMKDDQVYAIYRRTIEKGANDKTPNEDTPDEGPSFTQEPLF